MEKAITATLIIWYRELLHYWRDRVRAVSSLMMPFIWLVLFGSGISSALQFTGQSTPDFSYITFLFPGVLGITVLFTSIFSAISIVADREFGFLKEILVAPIPRASIALGKILGGSSVATVQGILMTVLLPVVGLPLSFSILKLIPFIFLFALMITSLGVMISAKMKSMEGFQMVMQFLTAPMFMLSGALFPLSSAPQWLETLSAFNPATYSIDLLRKIAFRIFEIPEVIADQFGASFFGYTLTPLSDFLVVTALAFLLIIISTKLFSKQEK